jgi:hypothetical protein
MKLGVKVGTLLACLLIATTVVFPQDQAKSSNEQISSHLRIDFLLTEYNGQQKISSLPYTISMESGPENGPPIGSIRMGVKVPIAEGVFSQGQPTQFTYTNVGTDIDCRAKDRGDGSYDLALSINRSSVYTEAANATQAEEQTLHAVSTHPVIQNFSTNFPLRMRDGDTQEGTSATDPFNGHVLKVTVTLHVVK